MNDPKDYKERNSYAEAQRDRRIKNTEKSVKKLWNMEKRSKIHVTGVPEKKTKKHMGRRDI